MSEHLNQIKAALLYLDGACDGANKRDDVGFNGQDTRICKYLARLVREGKELTRQQEIEVVTRLQKYRLTQLLMFSFPTEKEYEPTAQPPGRVTAMAQRVIKAVAPQEKKAEVASTPHSVFSRDATVIVKLAKDESDFRELYEKVKSIQEARYKWDERVWLIPRRRAKEVVAAFTGTRTSIHYLINKWAEEQDATEARLAETHKRNMEHISLTMFLEQQSKATKPVGEVKQPDGLGVTLSPYQLVPLEIYDRVQRGMVIADDMGLGKTFESLAIALRAFQDSRAKGEKPGPIIIISPPALARNWLSEIKRAYTDPLMVPILLAGNLSYEIPKWASVFVLPDSFLVSWKKRIREANPICIIADEAHRYKNASSDRSKAFLEAVRGTPVVIPLTGTPIENTPEDYWPALSAIDPVEWGSLNEFKRLYSEHTAQYGALAKRAKLYCVRRTLKECGTQVPDKTRIAVRVPMSASGAKLYKERMTKFFEELEKKEDRGENTHGSHLAMIEALKQAAFEGKKDSVLEWIETFLESNDGKLAVGVHHHEAAYFIEEFLKSKEVKFTSITGRESGEQIQKNKLAFQSDPSIRVVIISVMAGGLGHTLTAASNMLTVEFWWTPTSHNQLEARLYRRGQEEKTFFHYLLAESSIDEHIFSILNRKLDMISRIQEENFGTFNPDAPITDEVIDLLWQEFMAGKSK